MLSLAFTLHVCVVKSRGQADPAHHFLQLKKSIYLAGRGMYVMEHFHLFFPFLDIM